MISSISLSRNRTPVEAPRRGFTLLELLIVIAIISGLIAILVPALSAARSRGKRTACANVLRQVGLGLRSYMDGNGDIFPYMSFMPSISPEPVQAENSIYLADVLLQHVGGQEKAFACPNDVGAINRGLPHNSRSYFETERSSYAYRDQRFFPEIGHVFAGRTMEAALKYLQERTGRRRKENEIWLFTDYDNFHGEGGKEGARRYVYYDGHVTDFED